MSKCRKLSIKFKKIEHYWENNFEVGQRLLLAIPKAQESHRDFTSFDESLCAEIPDEVKEMEEDLAAWELSRSSGDLDKTLHNPYHIPKSSE